MLSTGTEPLATTNDTPQITVLPATEVEVGTHRRLAVSKNAAAACFVSIDGGKLWRFMAVGKWTRTFDYIYHGEAVLLKRATLANVTDIYADLL